jgi:hypothetical protein
MVVWLAKVRGTDQGPLGMDQLALRAFLGREESESTLTTALDLDKRGSVERTIFDAAEEIARRVIEGQHEDDAVVAEIEYKPICLAGDLFGHNFVQSVEELRVPGQALWILEFAGLSGLSGFLQQCARFWG